MTWTWKYHITLKDRASTKEKKNTKHVPTNFFSTQKRTNRSLARTNKACTDLKIFQQLFQNLWWYLVVFGSRSVLFGILLIKTLPWKCISQIRLDINKIKKKIRRNAGWRRRRKKKKRKKIQRMTKARETFTTERLVAAWRGQSREKRGWRE